MPSKLKKHFKISPHYVILRVSLRLQEGETLVSTKASVHCCNIGAAFFRRFDQLWSSFMSTAFMLTKEKEADVGTRTALLGR